MPGFPPRTLPAPPTAPATAPPIPRVPSHWNFPADPASVHRARRAVAEALPDRCRPQLADDLTLVVSELTTNAVRYGSCAGDEQLLEVVLWAADGHYWVAVSDAGDRRPALLVPGPDAAGGRGLVLVDALAAAWGVVARPVRGKSVVAGLPLDHC